MANRRRRKRRRQGKAAARQNIDVQRARGVVAKFERQETADMAAARSKEARESIAQQRRDLDAQGTHAQRLAAARSRAARGQTESAERVRGVIETNIASRPQRHGQAREVAGQMEAVGQARRVIAQARQGQGDAPPPGSVERAQAIIAQAGAKPVVRLGGTTPTTQPAERPAESPTTQPAPSQESQDRVREVVKDRLKGRAAYERAKGLLQRVGSGGGNSLGRESSGRDVVMRVRRAGDNAAGQAMRALEEMAGHANQGSVSERESVLADIDAYKKSQGIDLAKTSDPRVAVVAARINMARKGLEVQRIVETKATAKEKAKVKSPEQLSVESLVDLMGKSDPEQRRAALDLFEQKHAGVDLKKYPGLGEAVRTARARLKEEEGQERRGELTTLIEAADVEDHEAAATALRQIDEQFKPAEQEKLGLKGRVDIVRKRLKQETHIRQLRRLETRHGARLKVLEGRRDTLESERAAAVAASVAARQAEEDSLARSAVSKTAAVLDKTRVIALHHTRMVRITEKLKELEPKIETARTAYTDAVKAIDDYYGSLEREATAGDKTPTTQPASSGVVAIRQRLEGGESWDNAVADLDPDSLTDDQLDVLDELREQYRKK